MPDLHVLPRVAILFIQFLKWSVGQLVQFLGAFSIHDINYYSLMHFIFDILTLKNIVINELTCGVMQNITTSDLIFKNKFNHLTVTIRVQFIIDLLICYQVTLKFWLFFVQKIYSYFLDTVSIGNLSQSFFEKIKPFINITNKHSEFSEIIYVYILMWQDI